MFWAFTAIFRFAEQPCCGALLYKNKRHYVVCLLVHAHHQLLRNATALRCLASLLVARSTTFAHPKCRGAWVCFTCGRSGETCSKRSARNSEPCEFTHLGERHTRFREFSAAGTGHSPKERHDTKKAGLTCLLWSEWRDLNSRPLGPEPSALPNCATPRQRS